MDYSFDPEKDRRLRIRRGIGFDEVSKLFETRHIISMKNDDPEQYRAIGQVSGKLWTIIFEDIEDEIGELRWLVTFWPATTMERAEYEKEAK